MSFKERPESDPKEKTSNFSIFKRHEIRRLRLFTTHFGWGVLKVKLVSIMIFYDVLTVLKHLGGEQHRSRVNFENIF